MSFTFMVGVLDVLFYDAAASSFAICEHQQRWLAEMSPNEAKHSNTTTKFSNVFVFQQKWIRRK